MPMVLRGAVIHRMLSLGSQSEAGEQRIARLLSPCTTCHLKRLSLHAYLVDLIRRPRPALARSRCWPEHQHTERVAVHLLQRLPDRSVSAPL
jgi:hypothetical protein